MSIFSQGEKYCISKKIVKFFKNFEINKLTIIGLIVSLMFTCLISLSAEAYRIDTLPDPEISGNFILRPAKVEARLKPGQEIIRNLEITNQTGHPIYLRVEKEDFEGTEDPTRPTLFLGEKEGASSLRDWLLPEIDEFSLENGQRINLNIKISVPQKAEVGGHYGAVFFASQPNPEEGGQTKMISRIGCLFFVIVEGRTEQIKEEGILKEFSTDKFFYQKTPVKFNLVSKNSGSVHLNPYGLIEVMNILGGKITEIRLDPWFVMPDSIRLRELVWPSIFSSGLYRATAKINRGYQNIIDEKSVYFLILSWPILPILLIGLIGLILAIVFLIYFFLKKKKDGLSFLGIKFINKEKK